MTGRLSRGFTLIELAVVVVCIGVLSGLLLERVFPLIALAERTAFQQVRGQLASALLLEAAERVARGESASLAELDGTNPMDLLLTVPSNYLGPLDRPDPRRLPRRAWYFDVRARVLVYRAGRAADLRTGAGPADSIGLGVRFIYRDRDGNGRFDPAADRFDGLSLVPVEPFGWSGA